MAAFTWRAAKAMAVILGWTAIYYSTSAASGIWNKQLVDKGAVSPTVLTLLHLLVSLGSDMAIMRYSKEGPAKFPPDHGRHTTWDIVAAFTPISVFVIMSKLSTYFSYQYVSIALSHTAKASEPIFNVLVAAAFFGEFHTRAVYVSLMPIALGVWMASVTDFSYNHIGFFWAVTSALMKVLQNIYTKKLMSAGKFTFWEIHMYCGAASLAILAPVLVMQTATSAASPFAHFPAFQLLMCSVLQWASSVSSYMVLLLVSHLTFTIINVMKRLVIIVSGMLVYRQDFTVLNTLGVVLSVVGILCYNLVKDSGSLPPLPKDVTSVVAWVGWVSALLWRYNHHGGSSDSSSSSSSSVSGGAGGALGDEGSVHHDHGGSKLRHRDGDVETGQGADAPFQGSAATTILTSSGAAAAAAGSSAAAGGSAFFAADGAAAGVRRQGAAAAAAGAASSHMHSPPPHIGHHGHRGGGGYLAGFISPLNTPFGASFYDGPGGGGLAGLAGALGATRASDDSDDSPVAQAPSQGGSGAGGTAGGGVARRLQLSGFGVGAPGSSVGGAGASAGAAGGAGINSVAVVAGSTGVSVDFTSNGLRERSVGGGGGGGGGDGTFHKASALGSGSMSSPRGGGDIGAGLGTVAGAGLGCGAAGVGAGVGSGAGAHYHHHHHHHHHAPSGTSSSPASGPVPAPPAPAHGASPRLGAVASPSNHPTSSVALGAAGGASCAGGCTSGSSSGGGYAGRGTRRHRDDHDEDSSCDGSMQQEDAGRRPSHGGLLLPHHHRAPSAPSSRHCTSSAEADVHSTGSSGSGGGWGGNLSDGLNGAFSGGADSGTALRRRSACGCGDASSNGGKAGAGREPTNSVVRVSRTRRRSGSDAGSAHALHD